MTKYRTLLFALLLFLIGFLLAVQYTSLAEPSTRDTRDLWELRNELIQEKRAYSELLGKLEEIDETLEKYDSSETGKEEEVLADTVYLLEKQYGITPLEGKGLRLKVAPSPEVVALGLPIHGISADLLMRFVNDLNRVPNVVIDIDNKRYTTRSAIRDINGVTTVNGLEIKNPPFYIHLITDSEETTEKVYNYLLSSNLIDEFYIDDLTLEIEKLSEPIELKPVALPVRTKYLTEHLKGEQ